MKRNLVIISFLVFTVAGLNSCKKCYTCQFSGGVTKDLCSKDFPDGTAGLKLTITEYEKQGYECNEQ